MTNNKELKERYFGGKHIIELITESIDNDLSSHKPTDVDKWDKEQWLEVINRHLNRWYKWCDKRLNRTIEDLEQEEERQEINILRFTKTPNHNAVLIKYKNNIIGEININMLKHFINCDERDFLEVFNKEM